MGIHGFVKLDPALRFIDCCAAEFINRAAPGGCFISSQPEPPGSHKGWQSVLLLARQHGLSPLLGYLIEKGARVMGSCPDMVAGSFKKDLKESTIKAVIALDERDKVFALLHSEGIAAILVKGGALLDGIYCHFPGIRPLTDLDIVVPDSEFDRAADLFKRQGASVEARRPPYHQLMTWSDRRKLPIDLHGRFFQSRLPLPLLGYTFPEQHFIKKTVCDKEILSPAEHCLYLVYHALQHSFGRMIWWVDVALVLTHFTVTDREELSTLLETSGFRPVFEAMLMILDKRWGCSFLGEPPDRDRFGFLIKWGLSRVIRGHLIPHLNVLAYLSCAPRKIGIPAFLGSVVFPGKNVLAGTYPSEYGADRMTAHWMRTIKMLQNLTRMLLE